MRQWIETKTETVPLVSQREEVPILETWKLTELDDGYVMKELLDIDFIEEDSHIVC